METLDQCKIRAKKLAMEMTLEEKTTQLRYISPAIQRLGIPAYNWWNEALHGVARAGVATSFPQAIGLASIFDEAFMEKIADAISTEGRAKYNESIRKEDRDIYKGLTFWCPNINIFRDPRWGRGHETFGEDPFLTARLGVSYIRGIQGDKEYLKAAACAKHFAVHSGPEQGRHEFNSIVSKKDLYETYLPAFEAAVKEAKVEGVMGAYNRTNGEPCCGSNTLLREILRGQWGFDGYIVSDCGAIADFHEHHRVTSTAEESAAMALSAGCDLNCGNIYLYVWKAVQDGLITEEQVTSAVEHLLTTRFRLGMFDQTEFDTIPYEVVECKEHLALSEEAARKSMVLLKNNGILPLKKEELKTIGVIGPNANSRDALKANYFGTSSRYITALEGIQDEAGENIRVLYSEGSQLIRSTAEGGALPNDRLKEALSVAERSDVVILCMGLDASLEGEEGDASNEYCAGDRMSLSLPKAQLDLIEAIAGLHKPTILCNMVGSATDLRFAHEHFDAVLQVWYPGARGGKALADLLFGHCSPSGKLPVTFYHSVDDLPDFTDYAMKDRTYRYMTKEAFYPFGFGLTYSQVMCKEAKILGTIEPDQEIELQVKVENIGDFDTEEVIEVYIKVEELAYAVPNYSLCGFKRVSLKKGEEKEVIIRIPYSSLEVVDENGERRVDSGKFTLYSGLCQPDSRSVSLYGQKPLELNMTVSL
ncbi:MAG: glycosyl hydrolase [Herbinix sp.]|nr:glycosyl hydrolase [Herbinix sp.]